MATLPPRIRFALTQAIIEKYSASARCHQIAQIRKAFNIPGNRPNLTKTETWKTNIERRLSALECRVDVYIGPGK